MPCHAIRGWTFSGLVGAFLGLSITFLLLCASTLAYLASKFLGLLGLDLPCPCNSFFGVPDNANNTGLQKRLVDYPLPKIFSVQSSAKSKFPFGTLRNDLQFNSNKENDGNGDKHEGIGSEGEVSCISSSERRTDNFTGEDLAKMKGKSFVMGTLNLPDVKEGRYELKRKWVTRHRSRNGLRRRRKGSVDYNGKLHWVPSHKTLWSDAETRQSAPGRISESEDDTDKGCKDPANNFEACNVNGCEILDGKETSVDIGSKRKFSYDFELNESVDENEPAEKNASTAEEFNSHGNQVSDCNAKNTVRLLEQALEEEHAARAVLYIELEKERSAAASAADEAMAMILRLQEEKASIEMEARQCQRIIEEKYAYDAEEMNILKEILVRREREKYYLEKEVEAYRQKISGNEQLYAEMYGMSATKGEITLYTSDEDSVLKLPQSSDYIGEEEKAENVNWKDLRSTKYSEDKNCSNQIDIPRHPSPEKNPDEEKKAQKINATSKFIQSNIPPPHNLHQKAIDDKESEGDIHDVHVVDDQASVYKQVMRDKNRQLSTNAAATSKNPNISMGLPPTGSSRSRSLRYDMRRKSMSAFDVERFKIDNEIIWLREKLKFVQEGREKLHLTKGNKEREKIQLQTLEDIISQLREIRQLTEPGKAARRASLPLLTSNVKSKKRRWRSGPLLVEGSI
ncbi:myosin-binding protein 3 isoform X2 [Hevea brasiliensis]|uniref:myosin-binding protein 3 isoform X2 n=1 Tax=Hevea brasiliensis TaxID=3981 RepID=UPI0025E12F2E|nr:myosin-binding protein 3 isoform X2 [Hevea brasiliensis]